MIHYRNEVRSSGVDGRALKVAAQRLLAALDEGGSSLSLTLVGDPAIRVINREHRGKDRATDVLSFPFFEDALALGRPRPLVASAERLLGDVVISVDTARRQAADYDASLQDELYRLLIHGVAHVMGHDHQQPKEREAMLTLERRLAVTIGLDWPFDG